MLYTHKEDWTIDFEGPLHIQECTYKCKKQIWFFLHTLWSWAKKNNTLSYHRIFYECNVWKMFGYLKIYDIWDGNQHNELNRFGTKYEKNVYVRC